MMDSLQSCLQNRWTFWLTGWKYRGQVIQMICKLKETETALTRAELEIEDLKRRLEFERVGHHKSKGHVDKLWKWIATRHRVDEMAQPGTIRRILQEAEKP